MKPYIPKLLPKYPVYVISKGRYENCLTAKFLEEDSCPFFLVVEPQEEKFYRDKYPNVNIKVLPFSNLGLGSIPARNWCWEDSIANGHERHWILDDNIRKIFKREKAHRIRCRAGIAFKVLEDFTDRYENIAIAGMNYGMFVPDKQKRPPFWLNVHVYSTLLIMNNITNRWRGRYNEDTDLCLQVLADGWCTILTNAFAIDKMATLTMKGGNMESLYKGDGRLTMAKSLERMWPGVVTVNRRFNRPQHVIKDCWRKFDTPLKLKEAIFEEVQYDIGLKKIKEVKSDKLKKLFDLETKHAEQD